MNQQLVDLLKRHEGFRQFPYCDSVGVLTIGYGRNLEINGLSRDEAEYLLKNDITVAENGCIQNIPGFMELDEVRKAILIDMALNLGVAGLMNFHDTLEAIHQGDYDGAAECMINTKWYSQVKNRGIELVTMMRTGQWLDQMLDLPSANDVLKQAEAPKKSWWSSIWG